MRPRVTVQEKSLYHQIHPLKLFTDISTAILSLYLLWQHELAAGQLVMFHPPITIPSLLLRLGNLEKYKHSALDHYIHRYMTSATVFVRLMGLAVAVIGAWFGVWWLIPLGLVSRLFGWVRGWQFPY